MHMDRAEGDIVPGMMFQVSNGTFLVPNRRSTVYDDRAGLRLQIDNYRMWVPELDLTFLDKYQIRLDCWLTNKHINACHHMLRRQFPAYIGFQDSRLSNYEHGFDNISYHYYNAMQIHHLPSGSHWITTQFKRGKVFLYDSSYTGHISSDLQMQVQNIYGDRDIHQVHVHQQEGRNNCGVLAIAFALHAARGDLIETIRFDEEKMRYHLMQCFEEQFFRPFPTLQKQDDKVRPSLIKPNQIQRDQRVKMATPTPVSLYASGNSWQRNCRSNGD